MPELEIVSLEEAKGQGKYLPEYIGYIQQIPKGQAGKLRILEDENASAVRRRLTQAAQALGISLIIKRSGQNVYFWVEPKEQVQPRRGRPPRAQEQPPMSEEREAPVSEEEEIEQEEAAMTP
jgi:hypothetical protein